MAEEELKEPPTLNKLKHRNSPVKDRIPYELLKNGGPELNKQILELIQKIFENNRMPQEWRSSIVIPLLEKEDKGESRNYRGISLLNVTLKLDREDHVQTP